MKLIFFSKSLYRVMFVLINSLNKVCSDTDIQCLSSIPHDIHATTLCHSGCRNKFSMTNVIYLDTPQYRPQIADGDEGGDFCIRDEIGYLRKTDAKIWAIPLFLLNFRPLTDRQSLVPGFPFV